MNYAKDTEVTVDKSQTEIQRILRRYGAIKFVYGWEEERALVQFEMRNRRIRFVLPLPDRAEFKVTTAGRKRINSAVDAAYEQATRQRWRALALSIKAKLESVESGIEQFEEAFMAQIVLPNGKTVGEWVVPQIEASYSSGNMPPMLPAPGDKS